jgi:colanic acid/amylovoran biosynthesis glycosyltransferase
VGGVPELVQPGINGFLVPPGSVDDLAEAMRAVVGAPVGLLAEMGRHGAARVADRHDAAANARQLEALMWCAVNRHREASAAREPLGAPTEPL